ncbi:MAG: sulfurtransferase, partial [Proteobacteria bacterium]|nr:sulfurtransferase [Pseudomonadota bacterium]
LDARSEERFKGLVDEPRAGLRRGHIPTACSMPFSKVLNGTLLKSAEELKALFQGQGSPDQEVIVYCGSGVTACIVALGLEAAGYPKVSVYDGSWSEWGA